MAGLLENQSQELPYEAAEKVAEAIPTREIDNGEVIPVPSESSQSFSEQQIERLAIMTTDGGMSDEEAMRIIREG